MQGHRFLPGAVAAGRADAAPTQTKSDPSGSSRKSGGGNAAAKGAVKKKAKPGKQTPTRRTAPKSPAAGKDTGGPVLKARAPPPRVIRRPPPKPAATPGPDIRAMTLFGGAFLLALLWWQWHRDARGRAADERDSQEARRLWRWDARPVMLPANPGVDPRTVGIKDVFHRTGMNRLSKPAPELVPASDSNDQAARDLEALASLKISLAADGAVPAEARPDGPVLMLPALIAEHYSGGDGERLEWAGATGIPWLHDGMLAITDRRILAVYHRRDLLPLPPFLKRLRRHQQSLAKVTHFQITATRRPELLAAATLTFWWWPAGSLISAVLVGLYFAWTRPELLVEAGETARRYPLGPQDLESARQALTRAIGRGAREAAAPRPAGPPRAAGA